jgi:hypothetical protein
MRLLYYKPSAIEKVAKETGRPDVVALSSFTRLYSAGSIPVDRNGTFTTPVKIRVLFPMPAFRPFAKTYEEICNERARELIERADTNNVSIYIQWSGGIDSTTALVSLLKNSTLEQRKRIVVLMSEESISENPNFYNDYLRGKLALQTSASLPYILGTRHILVNGEHNDQLFGSDMIAALIRKYGAGIIHKKYDRAVLFEQFSSATQSDTIANMYLDLFDRLRSVAPFPLESFRDVTWWVNFSLKWQTVYTRTLTYTSETNANKITADYAEKNYAPFFNTEDFQLWSMNNHDKKIKDTWASYKFTAKDLIYDFNKDAEYRDNKVKVGSLGTFVRNRNSFKFVDENFGLHKELAHTDYLTPDNDFASMV